MKKLALWTYWNDINHIALQILHHPFQSEHMWLWIWGDAHIVKDGKGSSWNGGFRLNLWRFFIVNQHHDIWWDGVLDGMTQVLVFGDVATGWFVIQERGGGGGGSRSVWWKGKGQAVPSMSLSPHPAMRPVRALPSILVTEQKLIMLQTYGEAWLLQ